MSFLIVIIIVVAILLCMACLTFYYLWCLSRKSAAYRMAILSMLIFITYLVVTAIWPSDSFYIDEFEDRSGIRLPSTAKVIAKDSSYPDFHGDYFSEALIELRAEDFVLLQAQLVVGSSENCAVPQKFKPLLNHGVFPVGCGSISKEEDDRFEFVLLSDHKTIYFRFDQT